MMSLVLLGDYVSFYLSILNRIDPTPVDSIDFIKQYLARSTTVVDNNILLGRIGEVRQ